ncbi:MULTISPECIES: hypothetical protein [Photorhabdus]|uniref:hypothetical protein n=1 Tax=Photorhabdus TaxID=29487 RepID=UPI000DCF3728|nr:MULTISPECIES: hypothetical protein [Photorhabdus]MCT8342019.1 hypothetical protein [Photorhabdus kleinii]RAX01456.1 hypothetical protein CKY03_05950 [Photorhabdus sp. S9-53]RAX02013.1 hypothetical protein CKY05_05190 [Photorhabdus sp. S10-54]RAX05147.1 hypothetical protein CKY04_06095 [Photorhabdus sp. S8-52]
MDFLNGLGKNICPVCGEKECKYPKDKRWEKVLNRLMENYAKGNMTRVKMEYLNLLSLRKSNFSKTSIGATQAFNDNAKKDNSMSSFGLLSHFFGKSGREISLSEIGVHDQIRGLMQKPGAFGRSEGSIQSRFISQIQNGERIDFKNGYDFGTEKKVPVYDPLWGIGGATVSGKLTDVSAEKMGDGYNVYGVIHYKLYDKFTDPYDTFNWGKEDNNWFGEPFDITGEWKENVNFHVERQIFENKVMQLLKK